MVKPSYVLKNLLHDHHAVILLLDRKEVAQDTFHKLADHLVHQAQFEFHLIFPILLEPCEWENSSLKHIPVYPLNKTPISQWESEEAGWRQVLEEIYAVLKPYSSFYPETDRTKALRSIGKVSSGVNQMAVSGFLLAPDLLLTSTLVINSEAKAKEGFITFRDAGGLSATFQLRPDRFFLMDTQTETVLVSMAETPTHSDYRNPRTSADYFTLRFCSDPVKSGDTLDAAHFDRAQQLLPNTQTVQFANDNEIQFSGPGIPGTAGGPLLNEKLEVVAVNPASREMFPNNPKQQQGKGKAPTINALLQRIMDEESEGTWAFEEGKFIRPALRDSTGKTIQFKHLVFRPVRVMIDWPDTDESDELMSQLKSLQDIIQLEPDEAKAEYVVRQLSDRYYISCPITEEDPQKAFRPLVAPVRVDKQNAVSLLVADLRHIAHWEYLKKYTNPSQINNLVKEPLRIDLIHILANGYEEPIPLTNNQADLLFEKVDGEWGYLVQVTITNQTNQPLFVTALYLSMGFESYPSLLPDHVFRLEAGQHINLRFQDKPVIPFYMDEFIPLYNWSNRIEYFKFMVSDGFFNFEMMQTESLQQPITLSDSEERRDQKYDRGVSKIENFKTDIRNWVTQLVALNWINPLYNRTPEQTVEAMRKDPELRPFAHQLYPLTR